MRCPTWTTQESAGRDEEESTATVSSGESKRDKPATRPGRGRTALDRQLRRAMDANLQELELMHKRVKNYLFSLSGDLEIFRCQAVRHYWYTLSLV